MLKKYGILLLSVALVISLVANVVIYTRFTTLRPLVTIGGHSISKREYLADLDAASGKAVLSKLVFAELVRQAAAKAGVTPSASDIDARLKLIQQKQPQLASSEPVWQLRDDIATDLGLENLRLQNVSVSEQDVRQFYQAHRQSFRQPGHVQIAMVVSGNATDAATAQRLLEQGYTTTSIAKQPNFHVPGSNGYTITLSDPAHAPLVRKLLAIPPKQTRIFPFDNGQFLTAKVYTATAPGYEPLSQIHGDVERLARLEKATPANIELARLYKSNTPVFDIDLYKSYFTDVEQIDTSSPKAGKLLQQTAQLPSGGGQQSE